MNKTEETKPCELCSNPFVTKLRYKRYCDSCNMTERGKRNNKPTRVIDCRFCGKLFTPRTKLVRVCSKACGLSYRYQSLKIVQPARPCAECGAEFNPRNQLARFCQDDCRVLYNRKAAQGRGKAPLSTEAFCAACTNPFIKTNGLNMYCKMCDKSRRNGRNQEKSYECKRCGDSFLRSGKGRFLYCGACRKEYPSRMIRNSENPCEYCGKFFTHSRDTARFCSYSCVAKSSNANGLGPKYNDDELLARIVSVIKQHPTCLSQEDLIQVSGTAANTLKNRGWTMEYLYEAAGRSYDRPVLNSYFEDRVHPIIQEIFPNSEIECDKMLPGMLGVKGGHLRADFYVGDQNLIVEADGNQHRDGRDDESLAEYIQANDRMKDQYATANGLTLIRIPQTVDRSAIREQLLRGIRRDRPGYRPQPLNPLNALNTLGPVRRKTPDRPKLKRGSKGSPSDDIYCRGCHSRPSYKNISTYLCLTCWDRWNQLRRSAQVLEDAEVNGFRNELEDFIKQRGRYVWQPEVYLYLRPVSIKELKRQGIKVATICRDLRLFAPADDRIVQETAQRVRGFVMNHLSIHKKTPNVREVMDGARVDHTDLWSCLDYEEFIGSLGGKIDTDIRYRFRDAEEFLQAAAQVVIDADCPLLMTHILDELGVSYPAYLSNFGSVSSEDIHAKAGVSRSHDGVASMMEAAGEKALSELGWEVERQACFPDLVGKGNRLLHYDFRLVGTRVLLEIDGPQHYDPKNTYFKESVKKYDGIKEDYARRHGYQLVRVDTRLYKSPSSMKEYLRPHIGINPLNSSNAPNTTGQARRSIKRGETRDRPGPR